MLFLLSTDAFFPLLIQPLWRFTDSEMDGTVLVYRSEDIKNISRLASSKVCGYVHAEANDLLPETARRSWGGPEEVEQEKGENCFSQVAPVLGRKGFRGSIQEVTNHQVRACLCSLWLPWGGHDATG